MLIVYGLVQKANSINELHSFGRFVFEQFKSFW